MIRTLPRASFIIFLILTVLLFASIFAIKADFFQFLVTAKQWRLEKTSLVVIAFLVLWLPFARRVKISLIDAGVLLLSIWWVLNEVILQTNYASFGQTIFQVVLWLSIYLFIHTGASNNKFIAGVAIVFLFTTFLQSGLGLLQLYGVQPSFHSLFRITGTFHNPGPFSGFVVSALPLAVICYTTCPDLSGEFHRKDTEKHGEKDARVIPVKWSKARFPANKILQQGIKWLSLLTIISILLIIPAAQSRAAWLAGIAGCLYVFLTYPGSISLRDKLKASFKRLRLFTRFLIITGAIIVIIGAGTGLYLMKQGSANGRLLMWQITAQLIKDRPLTGHGNGAFSALYMDEQANWFESGNGTNAQTAVAGSPEAPFNEPLKLWLEKGLIGLLLAGAVLGIIFFPGTFNKKPETLNYEPIKPHPIPPNPLEGEPQTRDHSTPKTEPETRNKKLKTRNSKPNTLNSKLRYPQTSGKSPLGGFRGLSTLISGLKGTLVSLLTFSIFSYPFDISSFILQLVVVVALLSATTPALITTKGRKSLLLTVSVVGMLIAAGIWHFPKRQVHYAALKTWQEAAQFYNMRSYGIATEAYEEVFPVLKHNGLFLQMYGKALSMNEQYKKSNKILTLAQNHLSSYIIQNTLGDNYKALGNYKKAETAYRKSASMVPSMLLPKYLLAKLYVKSDQHQKAKQTAQGILNSPVKIESTATKKIMTEMKEIVTQSNTKGSKSYTEITNNPLCLSVASV
ncbi:O-antigen ligase family protein [Marinilabilia rubra]|uniref:O-antigen ligase-related domain-containing protein n=1 Tax=Marinilabilia rubra TaxID=2162893 RepID=A0A2U2B7F6_9BACT|nr:O-antigen ligase family protein [Marinilabilia rubra]PWD99011.1 hypothetical protein DDZ16_12155 [Marinilabilia rubra]